MVIKVSFIKQGPPPLPPPPLAPGILIFASAVCTVNPHSLVKRPLNLHSQVPEFAFSIPENPKSFFASKLLALAGIIILFLSSVGQITS
jgi:hypothetical protein